MEGWRKIGDPVDFAKKYYEKGIDELIFIDVVASLYDRNNLNEMISEIASEVFIPLTAGGGIKNLEDAGKLLNAGADKITINTAAIKNPNIIRDISSTFGSQATVVAIEAKKINGSHKSWEPLTDNGRNHTGLDAIKWANLAEKMGAGEILVTSIDKDGTRLGCDLELFKSISLAVNIPVIGGGGVGTIDDSIKAFNETDIQALAIGSSLHYDKIFLKDLKKALIKKNLNIREK